MKDADALYHLIENQQKFLFRVPLLSTLEKHLNDVYNEAYAKIRESKK